MPGRDQHGHDHPHDHEHGHAADDPHGHRSLKVLDAPFDPANQSLADALRATFRVLKVFMLVVFVFYLFSNVFTVQQGEQALILSFGQLDPQVRGPGLHIAWPYPINEKISLPSGRSNSVEIDSHWLQIQESEKTLRLDQLSRGGGLHPTRDGALLTGDKGLVHVKWQVVFHIDDVLQYVRTVKDDKIEQAERFIRTVLEDVAIRNAAARTADNIVYRQPKELQDAVRRDLNARLAELETGIVVDKVDVAQSSMPVPTLQEYKNVASAENRRQADIREAEKRASSILTMAAGAAYTDLLVKLDAIAQAERDGDAAQAATVRADAERLLETEVGGEAGAMVQAAKASYSQMVQRMESDRQQFETHLPEYLRSPRALMARLLSAAVKKLVLNDGVDKVYVPIEQTEVRLQIGPDPIAQREKQRRAYELQQHGGAPH